MRDLPFVDLLRPSDRTLRGRDSFPTQPVRLLTRRTYGQNAWEITSQRETAPTSIERTVSRRPPC